LLNSNRHIGRLQREDQLAAAHRAGAAHHHDLRFGLRAKIALAWTIVFFYTYRPVARGNTEPSGDARC
jgi:hypothetical protein